MHKCIRRCHKQRHQKWKLYITCVIVCILFLVETMRVKKSLNYSIVIETEKIDEDGESAINNNIAGITMHEIHRHPHWDRSIDLQNQQGTNLISPTKVKYEFANITYKSQRDKIGQRDKWISFPAENEDIPGIDEANLRTNKTPSSRVNSSSKHFIILTAPRTGSNLLSMLLNQHSHVTSYHEILNQDIFPDVFKGENITYIADCMRANQTFLLDYITTMLYPDWSGDQVMTGFKLFTFHLKVYNVSLEAIIDVLESPNIVILHREDLLQQFISLKIAEATGEWSTEFDSRFNHSINLSIPEFQNYCLQSRALWTEALDSLKDYPHKISVTYESLVEDMDKVLNSIFEFSGYPRTRRKFFSFMKKQNPVDITKKIANYKEIELPLYNMITRKMHVLQF
ncbi:unnamed protein product [Owenia fusiformis]|uniref:Uncharacterized protein n=1 Tax=Owenia fusiformis TaxID=6347 RepID=A0A8J1UHC9_OWEFU|nr:unnamed protein product [Owenia fusiformis]